MKTFTLASREHKRALIAFLLEHWWCSYVFTDNAIDNVSPAVPSERR